MNVTTLNALHEVLRRGHAVQKVLISRARGGAKITALKRLCREKGIAFQLVPQQAIDRRAGLPNQGVFARVAPVVFHRLPEILQDSESDLILVLDGILDVGNMGAAIRTAVAAEVDAILIPGRKSAPLDEAVMKTSSGALAQSRIVLSRNLARDIDHCKEAGFWVVATTVREGQLYDEYDYSGKTVLVMGGEEKGVSPLMLKKADSRVSIPQGTGVQSLNVAVSCGIVLFEALRQRRRRS